MPDDFDVTEQEEPQDAVSAPKESASFPWLVFALAACFDIIGLIPIANFLSEAIACFIFGLWQKLYMPKTNPIVNLAVAKIADVLSLGILPSNIAIVVFAFLKKRTAAKQQGASLAGAIQKSAPQPA